MRIGNELSSPVAITKAWGSQVPVCASACTEESLLKFVPRAGWKKRILCYWKWCIIINSDSSVEWAVVACLRGAGGLDINSIISCLQPATLEGVDYPLPFFLNLSHEGFSRVKMFKIWGRSAYSSQQSEFRTLSRGTGDHCLGREEISSSLVTLCLNSGLFWNLSPAVFPYIWEIFP